MNPQWRPGGERDWRPGPGVCTQEDESVLDTNEFMTPASERETDWAAAALDAETPAHRQWREGETSRAVSTPLPPAPGGTRHQASVFATLQREMEDASPRWLAPQFKMQRKLLPGGEAEEMRTNDVASFFANMLRQPFPSVWAHVARGSPHVQWYHSLFKFSNPEEADGAGAMREHGVVFGFAGERDGSGGAPQLFKSAPLLCHS